MNTNIRSLLMIGAFAIGCTCASAQSGTVNPPDRPVNFGAFAAGAFGNWAGTPGKMPALSPELKALLDQFAAQRESLLSDRRALLERWKNATVAERRALMEDFRANAAANMDELRQLGRQIRDELKKLREARRNGSTGG